MLLDPQSNTHALWEEFKFLDAGGTIFWEFRGKKSNFQTIFMSGGFGICFECQFTLWRKTTFFQSESPPKLSKIHLFLAVYPSNNHLWRSYPLAKYFLSSWNCSFSSSNFCQQVKSENHQASPLNAFCIWLLLSVVAHFGRSSAKPIC